MPGRVARRLVLLLLFPCVAASTARANEFTDFRVPANGFLQWTGSASGSGDWAHQTTGPNHSDRGSFRSELGSTLDSWRESDTHASSIQASASGAGSRRHSRDQFFDAVSSPGTVNVDTFEGGARDAMESIFLSTSQRWYPGGGAWNLAGQLSALVQDSQLWSDRVQSRLTPLASFNLTSQRGSSAEKRYDSALTAGAGVGLGRVRNATGVYEARVLEERLRARGALSRPLGSEARRQLADLMYARADFDASMDRPASPVWDLIAHIIEADGALGTPAMSASDLFALVEPYVGASRSSARDRLPQSPLARMAGWNAGLSVLRQTSRTSLRTSEATTYDAQFMGVPQPSLEFRFTGHQTQSIEAFSGQVTAEYHRPLNMRLQWDLTGVLGVPLRHKDRGQIVNAETRLGCIVADRWLATLLVRQVRVIDKDDQGTTRADAWSTLASASVIYFVADHVSLNASFVQDWDKRRSDLYYPPTFGSGVARYFNQGSLSFGLTYRFAGFARIESVYPASAPLN